MQSAVTRNRSRNFFSEASGSVCLHGEVSQLLLLLRYYFKKVEMFCFDKKLERFVLLLVNKVNRIYTKSMLLFLVRKHRAFIKILNASAYMMKVQLPCKAVRSFCSTLKMQSRPHSKNLRFNSNKHPPK